MTAALVGPACLCACFGACLASVPARAAEPSGPAAGTRPASPTGPARAGIRLVDVTARSGVTFVHDAAPTEDKYPPETMGAGVALLDHDGDGDLDLYFVQGRAVSPEAGAPVRRNELWRNDGDLRFTRLEGASGADDDGLGQGACVGDVDGDGDPDLFVTNVGRDALFLNQGNGRFLAAPAGPATADEAWSTSCTFFDADTDGDLDLHVVRYLAFDAAAVQPYCGDVQAGVRAYCHPDVYAAASDALYLNDGSGRFRDATEAAGLAGLGGTGLGVVATDIDQDGDADLLVANDSTANFFLRNDGSGHFRDVALLSGFAYNEDGLAEAGMGIVAGDVNADGRTDVFLTHLDLQTNTLYLQGSRGTFRDATAEAGLAEPSLGLVGFGVELWDADLDGDLDLFVANGHLIDNIAFFNSALTHAQPDQLLLNDGGGRFRACSPKVFDGAADPRVSRGTASGDLDGDGDLDLVVTANGGPARILQNDGAERHPMVVLQLQGTASNRDAIGARAVLRATRAEGAAAPGPVLARAEVQGGRSYLGDGTRRLHLACPAEAADVSVTWLGGATETFTGLRPFHGYLLVEGAAATVPPPALAGAPPHSRSAPEIARGRGR